MAKQSLAAKDREALGIDVTDPTTIPENISPVLKAQLLEEGYKAENGPDELVSATERQNMAVVERAAADGDKDAQQFLKDSPVVGTEPAPAPQTEAKPAARQNKAASKSN
jgi:hypothetical protein